MARAMMALLGSAALAVSSAALAVPSVAAAAAPAAPAAAPPVAGLLRTAPPAGFASSGTRNSTFLSTNWAGFVDGVSTSNGQPVVGTATFTSVAGSWTVPDLVPPRRGDVGTWVGIGGVNGALLQVGTENLWVHGRPEAWAFWEEVPGGPANLVARVPMGATVTGSVGESLSSTGPDWTLTLAEGGQTVVSEQVPLSSFAPQSTAEWITEDPTCLPGGRLCTFASFLPVHFSHLFAFAQVSIHFSEAISSAAPPFSRVLIVGRNGRPRVEVAPENPSSLPSAFTVTRVDAWGTPVLSRSPWGPGGPTPLPWGRFPGFGEPI